MKGIKMCGTVLSLACVILGPAAFAQDILSQNLRYRYSDAHAPNVVEVDRVVQPMIPRVLEQRVTVERKTTSPAMTLSPAETRSNYRQRLAHLSEQISMARSKGWLNAAQYDDLLNWHASVAKEESILRESGGGIIKAADVDMMEKHMTALAFAINKRIDAGSKIAGTGRNQF